MSPLTSVNAGRKRWPAFAASLSGHALVFALLASFDTNFQSEPSPLDKYAVTMLAPEHRPKEKLTWYRRPRRTVPEVRPDRPFGPLKTPAGEKTNSSEILIARSPKSESRQQLIRRPDHPEPLPVDVPAPNLVTLQLNDAIALAKPPPKVFVAPKSKPSPPPPRAALSLAEPPPALDPSLLQTKNDLSVPPLAQKKLPKFFVPPAARVSGSGAVPRASVPQELAPPPDVGSQAASATGPPAVILGLNPQAAIPPPGSRSGQFAKAPTAGPPSSGSSADSGAAVVPGVFAHGTPGPAPESAADLASGAPDRRLVKIIALPGVNRSMSAPLRPSSRIVPAAIEAVFANRNLYTLVIPGPQLPNYPGDWVLWFAEHQADAGAAARISAPIPSRKYARVDSADPDGAPPVKATLQFAAFLDHAGHVTDAKIVRAGHATDEFKRKALQELETWEFMPALRNGVPVDVDVVLEIPFEFRIAAAPTPASRVAQ